MPGYRCAACSEKRHVTDVFECAGCIGTAYCNARCQREHWPAHAEVCAAFAPLREMMAAGAGFDDLPDEMLEAVFMRFQDTDADYRAAIRLARVSVRISKACAHVFRERYWFNIGRRDMAPYAPENDANLVRPILIGPLWVRRYRDVMREFRYTVRQAEDLVGSTAPFWRFMSERQASQLFSNALTEEQRDRVCSLKTLDLSNGQLRELPREIGALKLLTHLYLSSNQLQVLPREIGMLTQLQYLVLNNNQLHELPHEIGALSQLRGLYLGTNPALGDTTWLSLARPQLNIFR